MSTNPNQGQNPDQTNPYGGYGGYSGGQPASSGQQAYDPNDPYADQNAQQGAYSGYGQQQQSSYDDQQQQQQTYYQPPASATKRQRTYSSSSSSTMNMDQNRAALFSYVLGWASGLVFLVMERKNSFVRFCAAQSFLFFGGVTIIQILIRLLSSIPLIGFILSPILSLLGTIVILAALATWIFLMFQAYRGVKVKIPIVGDYAEALVARLTRSR